MKLFTVDRAQSLKEGQVLTLTKQDPMNRTYNEFSGHFNKDDLEKHLFELFPDGLSMHGWHYLKQRHTFGVNSNFQHHTVYLTEMNLEYVRRSFFYGHPSRFQSLFACSSIEDAIRFRDNFGQKENSIYEIECKDFRQYDMSLIFLGTQNINGSYLCHRYWRGEAGSAPLWEHVVRLPVTVVNKVS